MPQITASKCAKCGKFTVPPRKTCPHCRAGGDSISNTKVEGRGKVMSWTTMEITPEGFKAPRTVALIDLDCGARTMCVCLREPKMDEVVQMEEREGGELVVI